jgi:hypothetical protein
VLDDYVRSAQLPTGETLYTCHFERKHPDEPYTWTYDEAGKARGYPQEGLAAELNLFEDISKCFHEGDGWLEYGIIEDRFKALSPEKFESLRGIYGHTILDGPRKYSMSTYIARHVLSKLESFGELAWFEGKPTSIWRVHNSSISFWARMPAPSRDQIQTYGDYFGSSGQSGAQGR